MGGGVNCRCWAIVSGKQLDLKTIGLITLSVPVKFVDKMSLTHSI